MLICIRTSNSTKYEKGVITDARLDEAVRRVLTAMEFVAAPPAAPSKFTAQDEENLHAVARDCITAVTDEGIAAKCDRGTLRQARRKGNAAIYHCI